jgi:hypothetical protein
MGGGVAAPVAPKALPGKMKRSWGVTLLAPPGIPRNPWSNPGGNEKGLPPGFRRLGPWPLEGRDDKIRNERNLGYASVPLTLSTKKEEV